MKIKILLICILMASCNGSSKRDTAPKNISIKKLSEGLTADYFAKELKNIKNQLESVDADKGAECNYEKYKEVFKSVTLSFQAIAPFYGLGLIGDNYDLDIKGFETFYNGALGYSKCNAQILLAKGDEVIDYYIKDNSYINTLEFVLYGDVLNKNYCNAPKEKQDEVNAFLSSPDAEVVKCEHLKYVTQMFSDEAEGFLSKVQTLVKDPKSKIYQEKFLQNYYDSLNIFVDKELKDRKVNTPLGFSDQCSFQGQKCPYYIDHQFSNLSFDSLLKNTETIMYFLNERIDMKGEPKAQGLYQYLKINKFEDLAKNIYVSIQELYNETSKLKAQGVSYVELVEKMDKEKCAKTTVKNPLEPICLLKVRVKKLSDYVKNDLRVALSLSKTQQTAGDVD